MKVLLVDDHVAFARTVTAAFLQAHDVTLAHSIADARHAIAAQSFDLVLVDYDLPDGKGDDLVRELPRTGSQPIVLGISAHDAGNAALVRAGARAVCPKTKFAQISAVIAAAISPTLVDTILFTAAGGARNEDRGLVLTTAWGTILCVADGAGGTGSGDQAAEHVVSSVEKLVVSSRTALGGHRLEAALLSIDHELSRSGMGAEASCVVAEIVGTQIVGASVGDSGALLVDGSRINDLTAQQVRKPLLGSGAASAVIFGPEVLAGLLVVATDGLTKYAPRAALQAASAASGLIQARDILAAAVRLRSGAFPDDVTFVLSTSFL